MNCRKILNKLVSIVELLDDKYEDQLIEYDITFYIPLIIIMIEGGILEDAIYLLEIWF